jgi:tetratricopeptide (TPR) repeat protein
LAKNKQYPEAVASFNRSIEFRPNHPATWKRLAKAQEDMGVNSVTVLITMQRALSLDSKDDEWRVSIAKFQHERLDFRGSINTIKSGYSSMKKLYAAQFLLAWNYIELKKWNNARKHIQIAENLDKSKFNILKSMGFYSENLYRESIDLLKQNKKFKQIHYYLLALNYVEKGGLKTASKNFQRIDSKSKFSLKSSLNLLVANQSKLSDKEINDQFNGLIEAGAIPIYPSYLAAKILSKKKQYADAENWLKDLSFPNSIKPANNLYAHVLWMQDKRNLAIGILEKTIEKNKKNHHSIRQLSEYLYSDKKYEKALLALEDFKIADFKVQDFILKGNIYISLNQLDQAEKLFKEGIEYWSKSTSIRFDFAKLLKLQNKTEQSKQQLVLILKLDKSHAKSIKLLSEYNK